MANSFTVRVTKAQADAFAALHGFAFGANHSASGWLPEVDGVQLNYATAETSDGQVAVAIAVIKKPFYVSMDQIKNHIVGLIGG